MNGMWWIPVVLGIWIVASVLLALVLGPVFRLNKHPLDGE